ncbi:MAG: FAD-dependent oxidoreductase [Bacteroidales bacterium]|nr:FAD-dependent oxidoreductase [Bacteroidales bacterium]
MLALCGCRHEVFIDVESFADKGGWKVDQQFMDVMGSPYLLAHGAGVPVDDASQQVDLPGRGEWHVFARTFNWVSPWYDGEGPGKFKVAVDGEDLSETLGGYGNEWMWQYAGSFNAASRKVELSLKDLTGFDGRCDAIYITRDRNVQLPSAAEDMAALRSRMIRNYDVPSDKGEYDFVVAGGGVAGMCAAVAAARKGLKVALIHDRPVLGGNNSSEVRVHLGGSIECGPYPNLGNMIKEFGHTKKGNAKSAENYEDGKKMAFVEDEENISLFLNCHVTGVEMKDGRIATLLARDIETGELMRFSAPLFSDCTGDAAVGFLAGAEWRSGRESVEQTGEPGAVEVPDRQVLGASVQWNSKDMGQESPFPVFEYGKVFSEESVQKVTHGEWTWETGMLRDQVLEAERVRDHGLLVVYSNWSYLKNRSSVRNEYDSRALDWVAYVAGKRESRRLLGDIVLNQNDIMNEVPYDDGTCATSWTIDLHYPDPANTAFFPGEEFKAVCTQQYVEIYPIPYRCFYSRNIPNLFMAGRNISVTHVALGTVRVMRTTAMMGEVVGLAAAVCHENACLPRDVYTSYLEQLKENLRAGAGKQGLENNQKFNVGRKEHLKGKEVKYSREG